MWYENVLYPPSECFIGHPAAFLVTKVPILFHDQKVQISIEAPKRLPSFDVLNVIDLLLDARSEGFRVFERHDQNSPEVHDNGKVHDNVHTSNTQYTIHNTI